MSFDDDTLVVFVGHSVDAADEARAVLDLERDLTKTFDNHRRTMAGPCPFSRVKLWEWSESGSTRVGGQAEVVTPILRQARIGVFVFKGKVGEVTQVELDALRTDATSRRHIIALFPESPPPDLRNPTKVKDWLRVLEYEETLSRDWTASDGVAVRPAGKYRDAADLQRLARERIEQAIIEELARSPGRAVVAFDTHEAGLAACVRDGFLNWDLISGYAKATIAFSGQLPTQPRARMQLLRAIGVVDNDDTLSRSAKVAFCLRPDIEFPQARSLFVRTGLDARRFQSTDVLGPASYQVQTLCDLVLDNVANTSHIGSEALRKDEPEFPPELVRELISNAIAHRDYGASDTVEVRLDPTWLEICSPGHLKQGLTWERLLNGDVRSTPVDLQLMLYLRNLLVAEQIGRGFEVIRSYLQEFPGSIVFDTPLGNIVRIRVRRVKAPQEVIVSVDQAGGPRVVQAGVDTTNGPEPLPHLPPFFVATGDVMQRTIALARRAAQSAIAVLVTGETGTGKELIAEMIHQWSVRANRPFVAINCAGLSEGLFQSEFFGYERGAFTGAVSARGGLIEQAEGGTVFLDEVGEMPLSIQAQLLRTIETRSVRRLGGHRDIAIDVRFVSATNRNLVLDATAGHFRHDLYYRLAGIEISVPPLRERRDEIPSLVKRFADDVCRALDKPMVEFSSPVIDVLQRYKWPGNVRELKNSVERLILLCEGRPVMLDDLPQAVLDRWASQPEAAVAPTPLGLSPDEVSERQRIMDALLAAGGNQTRAAARLNIPRRTFVSKLNRYAIPRPRRE
jgi:two-component system, NtrC family, response regulator AtoC